MNWVERLEQDMRCRLDELDQLFKESYSEDYIIKEKRDHLFFSPSDMEYMINHTIGTPLYKKLKGKPAIWNSHHITLLKRYKIYVLHQLKRLFDEYGKGETSGSTYRWMLQEYEKTLKGIDHYETKIAELTNRGDNDG